MGSLCKQILRSSNYSKLSLHKDRQNTLFINQFGLHANETDRKIPNLIIVLLKTCLFT